MVVSVAVADVRILGPVTVTGPAGRAGLSGGRQCTLVGVLALNAGAVVGIPRLVDVLWPDDPPRTAVRTLHSHAARVRAAVAACGLPDTLVTRGSGYLLGVPRAAVDALRLEDAVRAGRDDSGAATTDRLAAALASWHDEPLSNCPGAWAASEAARLHGLRLAAAERLWELRLARGEHAAAVTELDRLLVRYPTRERLVELLMLAFHRDGSPAAALDRYERLRVRLAEEFGADPGAALSRLHVAILRGDPALDLAGPTPPGRTSPGRTTAGRTTPSQTTPGRTTPGQTTPGRTTSGATTSGATSPGGQPLDAHPPEPHPSGPNPSGPNTPGAADPGPAGEVATDPQPLAAAPAPRLPAAGQLAADQLAADQLPADQIPARQLPATQAPAAQLPPAAQPPAPPAQLPPPVGHFSGRVDALRRLDDWLAEPGSGPRLALVRGPAGVGKTAFAVEWTRSVRDRFPDGQIFLDLRGHTRRTAVRPADALGHALRALGVPADRIPAEAADQVSAYRSLVHDKRILLVLDNAADAEQVLPLVPTGDASLLVVTSRHDLGVLLVHHAVCLTDLDLLTGGEAAALLERVLGADRVRTERAAVERVAELCGRLPLALRLAAAKLAGRPRRPVADLVEELAGQDRLAALSVDGDGTGDSDGSGRGLRAVFATAYGALTPPVARLFRLLGLQPGISVTASLAAAAAGEPVEVAAAGLRQLAAAHLIEDLGAGRYRFHDLIRLYAADRAAAEEPDRVAALGRILDWYLAVAAAVNRILDPGRDRVTPAVTLPELPFEPTPAAALEFLDGEHANLLSAVEYAGQDGYEAVAWQLCYLLAGYFESRGHWGDRVVMYRHGLAAAQRLDDPAVSGLMLSGLGVACIAARRHAEALEHLRPALELMRASGDERGEGHVHNNIAAALGELRRYGEAIESCERALAVHTRTGHRLGMRLALNNLGTAHTRVGAADRGIDYLERGLRLARDDGDTRLEAAILHSLGEAQHRCGRHADALGTYGRALELRRRLGERRYEVETLTEIGRTQLDAGDPASARETARAAYRLSRDVGDQHLEAVAAAQLGRAQLAEGNLAGGGAWLRVALDLRRRIPDRAEEAGIHAALAELAQHDPAQPDPAQHDPATHEPIPPGPGQAGPAHAEPTHADPAQADPAQAEPTQPDSGSLVAARHRDPARQLDAGRPPQVPTPAPDRDEALFTPNR
jgi:DNA-binding SARP family transcriptional activator/tetratricopeptide (TPR) repeat protein